MKTLKEQLDIYASYHQNPYNKLTHYFGIPVIIFSLLLFLSWFRYPSLPWWLNGALLFTIAVFIYYFLLDKTIAFIMAFIVAPLLLLAFGVSILSWKLNIGLFLALFIGGWILQFIGHTVFEKRRPAFTDNFIQLLIGPLFFLVEILRKIGFTKY